MPLCAAAVGVQAVAQWKGADPDAHLCSIAEHSQTLLQHIFLLLPCR